MPAKRRPRAKRPPAPRYRLRPASIDAQLRDAEAHARRNGEGHMDRTGLVLYRDTHGPEIWPDDPEVHAERAAETAVLDEYRDMFDHKGDEGEG